MQLSDPNTLTSQYEEIGAAAARCYRRYEGTMFPSRPDLKRSMTEFLRKYHEAPLFIIGLDSETMISIATGSKENAAGLLANFRLPYPTMVLDFPKGLDPRNPNDPCVLFIDTIGENHYYIEALRTQKAFEQQLGSLDEEEKRLVESAPTLPGQEIGESTALVLKLDPSKPDKATILPSGEYVNDCPLPVKPDHTLTGYCTFSRCVPPGGICPVKTPLCKNYEASAERILGILCIVMAYINRPDRYLVKITPEKTDREKRMEAKGRVLSFSKKASHVVLDHSQIREVFAAALPSSGGARGPVLPHSRRGHWRMLQADRYKEKKEVWVRPSDINKGMKVTVKKSIYEVVS